MKNVILIKFGGSLITDKNKPFTAKPEILNQLAKEFKQIKMDFPEIDFILGHGSGSFGHNVAKKYQTRSGINSSDNWKGFVEVWAAARLLNTIVLEAFLKNNINCISFPPSSIFKSSDGHAVHAYLEPLIAALNAGITPILYGDVIFDDFRGGTILSTEDIFFYLTKHFNVKQILLSGIEPAIYSDFPNNNNPIQKITVENFSSLEQKIGQSASPDVTGGMIEKVRLMMDLIKTHPHLKINIFSASEPGNIKKILRNEAVGTTLLRE